MKGNRIVKQGIVFTLVLLLVIAFSAYIAVFIKEHFYDGIQKNDLIKYFRIKDNLDYKTASLSVIKAMDDSGKLAKADTFEEAEFLIFETLNVVDELMLRVQYPRKMKFIYGVKGTDYLASKSALASVMIQTLPKELYLQYFPKTYVLDSRIPGIDLEALKKDFNPNKVYILKQNVQRQEGHKITNDWNWIEKNAKDYVVCQEMLQDPYLINKRKINLRIYLLVVIDPDNNVSMYIYDDGFIYYTPRPFQAFSLRSDEVITTGYIDRSVYDDNPMTLYELQKFIGHAAFAVLIKNIIEVMTHVKIAYTPIFKKENKDIPGVKFLIYGCDIAPDRKLDVKLMEVNKGPDLSYKDERDGDVKQKMVNAALNEAFSIVGFEKRVTNNFIKL